jgi:hypothetical protein
MSACAPWTSPVTQMQCKPWRLSYVCHPCAALVQAGSAEKPQLQMTLNPGVSYVDMFNGSNLTVRFDSSKSGYANVRVCRFAVLKTECDPSQAPINGGGTPTGSPVCGNGYCESGG